jgi:hypothetical protein
MVPGPVDQTYYLAMGPTQQLVFYEIDQSGKGAMITSHWIDEKGDHFFNYVSGRQAWEYVIPADRRQSALRLVYNAGAYSARTEGDQVRLASGIPMAVCDLVRTDQPPAPQGAVAGGIPAPAPAPAPAGPAWSQPTGTPSPQPPPAMVPAPGAQGAGFPPQPMATPAVPASPVRAEPAGRAAAPGPMAPPPPAPAVGGLCDSNADCKGDRICVNRHCTWRPAVISCQKDIDCPGDAICTNGQCVEPTPAAPSARPTPSTRSRSSGAKKRRP